jgi:hypothetical protein
VTYAPPTAPPVAAAPQSAAPAKPSALPARRGFAVVFSILAIVVTAGAIALATYAGQQYSTPQDAVPAGWSQVYDANLASADSNWDTSQGCQFNNGGLYAASDEICGFVPSATQDLTSLGFLFKVTVGPAAAIPDALQPTIIFGNSVYISVTQMGEYSICEPSGCPVDAQVRVEGTTIDWHGDPFVSNSMAVKYDAQAGQMTLYVNDIQVASATLSLNAGSSIALAAPDGAEALFTHATLYSASGTGSAG